MSTEKIVIGTDFSTQAEAALDHGLRIARHTGAELVLVHACSMLVEASEGSEHSEWRDHALQAQDQWRQQLEQLRERVHGLGVRVSHMIVEDTPAHGVIRVAVEIGAALTVVGTHGRTGLQRFLIGSEAERIVRGSEAPVMVARSMPEPPVQQAGYRRILVATDFSDTAELALQTAIGLVCPDGVIDMLHVWSYPLFGPLPDPGILGRQLQQKAASRGAALVERYEGHGYALSFGAVEGVPRQGVVEAAETSGYELVVVGSHGRRGPGRWLLGSVAESIARHAPCSVLIVKPGAEAD